MTKIQMEVDVAQWLLRLKFEQDKRFRYRVVSRTTQRARGENGADVGPPQEQGLELLLEQRVLHVDPDGSGHVTSVSTPQIQNGERMRTVIYQQLSSRGETLVASTPHQGSAFSFPEEAIALGSTWQGTTHNQLPNVPTPVVMTYDYKVEAEESVCERNCLRIAFSSSEVQFQVPLADGSGLSQVTTRTQGVMHFDPQDGCLVKLALISTTVPRRGNMTVEIVSHSEQTLL